MGSIGTVLSVESAIAIHADQFIIVISMHITTLSMHFAVAKRTETMRILCFLPLKNASMRNLLTIKSTL